MSSFITLVKLTLEIPGVATSPIDIGLTGISLPISTNSGTLRQDVTSVNPLGGVGGLTKASAFDGGEDVSTGGVLNRQDGRATGAVCKSTWDLPLGLGTEVGGGVSPATCTGWEGCRTISQPAYLEATCSAGDAWGDVSNVCYLGDGSSCDDGRAAFFLGEVQPLEDFFILECQVKPNFLPELYYTFC